MRDNQQQLIYLGSEPDNLETVRFSIIDGEKGEIAHGKVAATKLASWLQENGNSVVRRALHPSPAPLRTGTSG